MLKLLFIGDVVSEIGCNALKKHLSALKKKNHIDITIINGENSAKGNGISKESAQSIFTAGADAITTGNHVFKRENIYDFLDENQFIIRPFNFHEGCPGRGFCILDRGAYRVAVLNVQGKIFMDPLLDNPFPAFDRIINEIGDAVTIVDFHAEATSEKKAAGIYLDGKVSALIGTHTHVQTADEQILPNGTAYITDVGMTGAYHSILGVKDDNVIKKYLTGLPVPFSSAEGESMINGVVIEVDEKTKKAVGIKRVYETNL